MTKHHNIVPPLILAKTYQMMPVEQEALDQFVADKLKAGKIQESKLPYASPCFFIAKKDGSCRFVQDYQEVNAFTVKDKTLLPHIDDLLNVLEDGKLFTKRILSGDTTMYALRKVMNGKLPSSHRKASSSLPSCILAYAIHQEHLCT